MTSGGPKPPSMYRSHRTRRVQCFLAVRTAVPPMNVMPAVRDALLSLDKEQPVNRHSDYERHRVGNLRRHSFPDDAAVDFLGVGAGALSVWESSA